MKKEITYIRNLITKTNDADTISKLLYALGTAVELETKFGSTSLKDEETCIDEKTVPAKPKSKTKKVFKEPLEIYEGTELEDYNRLVFDLKSGVKYSQSGKEWKQSHIDLVDLIAEQPNAHPFHINTITWVLRREKDEVLELMATLDIIEGPEGYLEPLPESFVGEETVTTTTTTITRNKEGGYSAKRWTPQDHAFVQRAINHKTHLTTLTSWLPDRTEASIRTAVINAGGRVKKGVVLPGKKK